MVMAEEVKVDEKGRVTIPSKIREKLGIREGSDSLFLSVSLNLEKRGDEGDGK